MISACAGKTDSSREQSRSTAANTAPDLSLKQILDYRDSLSPLYSATTIDGAAVGYEGTMTMEYKSYRWLVNNAPDSMLVALTKKTGKYISTYAFMALCEKKPSLAAQQISAHLNDRSPISHVSGCISMTYPLNEFWLMCLKEHISNEEFDALKNKAGIKNSPYHLF